MSLNIKDGLGVAKTLKTTTEGSDLVPHHRTDATVGVPIFETGLLELIGKDDAEIDNAEYSKSVGAALGGTYSGRIKGVTLIATQEGTGAIITEAGTLLILDADPGAAAADTALTAAEHKTVIGKVAIADANWIEDANGATNFVAVDIPFHSLQNLYFVYKHGSATTWNGAAGDDEVLQLNAWYERSA